METKIKICGMRRIEDIKIINKYPVNYVGFIFAESKRKVTPEQAKEMIKHLRDDIKKVGVFVNEDIEKVNEIAKYCGLDILQLHGEENNEMCKKAIVPVWKSISVKDEKSIEIIKNYNSVSGFLLDTYSKNMKGGTGKTFNWELVKELSKDNFVILAGGLTPENILEAIEIAKPQVLDINSGVETDLYKDEAKIKIVFEKLKRLC